MEQMINDLLEESGISIQEFVSNNNDIFPNATSHPRFLDQNLLSSQRVIKYFADDPHSNFRVFYYHLLKLSYELVLEEGNLVEFPLNNFKQKVFTSDFQIRFSRQSQEERVLFNDFQFKRLLAQFFILLDNEEQPDIEAMINKYPIMDIIFIHVFRSLMCTLGIDVQFDNKIDTQTVFGSLCSLLQMGLAKYDNCWKFQQSDMFCLDETGTDLYFIYTLQQGDTQKTVSDNKQNYSNNNPFSKNNKNSNPIQNQYFNQQQNLHSRHLSSDYPQMKSSGRMSEFQKVQSDIKSDILKLQLSAGKLFSNSRANSSIQQNNYKTVPQPIIDPYQKQKRSLFSYDTYENKKQSFSAQPYQTHYDKKQFYGLGYDPLGGNLPRNSYAATSPIYQDTKFSTDFNFQPFKPYVPSYTDQYKDYKTEYQPTTYRTDPSTYPSSYSPSEYNTKNGFNFEIKITSPSAEQSTMNKSLSIGDYYKDFTNSFLLPMIREPFQANIRGLKNRIRGNRRQNILPSPF